MNLLRDYPFSMEQLASYDFCNDYYCTKYIDKDKLNKYSLDSYNLNGELFGK